MFGLGLKHGYTMKELEKVMTKSLEPTGLIQGKIMHNFPLLFLCEKEKR